MQALTKNFDLSEFIISPTAERRGIDNRPDSLTVLNLRYLCLAVLQPLRDHLGVPIVITSGFRCPELNTVVGGDEKSQHLCGEAADIIIPSLNIENVFDWMKENLIYDQLILETKNQFNQWIHVSYSRYMNRRECFRYVFINGLFYRKPV